MLHEQGRHFFRNVVKNWVGWLIGRVAGAMTVAVLARAYPAAQLGDLFSALAASLLISSLTLGSLPDILAREIASAGGEVSKAHLTRVVTTAIARSMGLALPAAALLVHIGGMTIAAGCSLIALAGLQSANLTLSALPRARAQAIRYVLVSGTLSSVLRLAAAVAALWAGFTAGVQLGIFAAGEALVLLLAVLLARPLCRTGPTLTVRANESAAGVVWPILSNADVLALQLLAGSAAAGLYGPVMRLGEFTTQAALAIAAPYLPVASRLASAGRTEDAARFYRLSARATLAVTLPVVLVLFVEAELALTLVLGSSIDEQVTVFRLLLVGYLIHVACGPNFGTLIAFGWHFFLARASLSICGVYLFALFFAAGKGIIATAIATCGAYIVANAFWTIQLRRLSVKFTDWRNLLAAAIGVGLALSLLLVGDLGPVALIALTLVTTLFVVTPLLLIPIFRTLRSATAGPR